MKNEQKLHLGFIVDGNRRWARERNLPTLKGHQKGLEKVEAIIEELNRHNEIAYASFYLFSTENWNRAREEVDYLMNLLCQKIIGLAEKMHKNNIKCVIVGSKNNVPEKVAEYLQKAEDITAECTGLTVAICFNYGGHLEIVEAVNQALAKGETITTESIEQNLYHPEIPPCDMVIRTSGEQRISGFMLWRASYAEFLFMDKYFPDIETTDVDYILEEYQNRNRRFGK